MSQISQTGRHRGAQYPTASESILFCNTTSNRIITRLHLLKCLLCGVFSGTQRQKCNDTLDRGGTQSHAPQCCQFAACIFLINIHSCCEMFHRADGANSGIWLLIGIADVLIVPTSTPPFNYITVKLLTHSNLPVLRSMYPT